MLAPVLVAAGRMQMGFVKRHSGAAHSARLEAARIASESVASIRTVLSLRLEHQVVLEYEAALRPPLFAAVRAAHKAGLGAGFSQLAIFTAYSLCFWYGSRLVYRGEVPFKDMLRVFCVLLNAAIGVGQAAAFLPDSGKAREAAARVFKMVDLRSAIDPASPAGVRPPTTPVSYTHLTLPTIPLV